MILNRIIAQITAPQIMPLMMPNHSASGLIPINRRKITGCPRCRQMLRQEIMTAQKRR